MSESPESRLAALGLELPAVPAPVAAYVPAVRTGQYVYTAGQVPMVDGKLLITGKVGAEVSAEEAKALARTAALNALAAIASVTGGLSAVTRVVKMTGFVASDPGFTGQPQVVNGASELMLEVFGDAGRHARSAVGTSVLPLDAPVEIELIVEVAASPDPAAPPGD
jgi:enamine deaminase RidA (YjgF/YER057c/UK114 family)